MVKVSRDFQVFVKPIGPICNLDCHYCYYLKKEHLYPKIELFQMSDEILEKYIIQHIKASPETVIKFSWHGGEPTLLGIDYFRKIVAFQRKYQPHNRKIINGIQTNGTLLDEDWCHFFSEEGFNVGISLDGTQELHNKHRVNKNQQPTHKQVMHGYRLLQNYRINTEILCVVNSFNVQAPLKIYHFFKQINAEYITFLPLVERNLDTNNGVKLMSVPPDAWGEFLCTIFNEWRDHDIGKIKIQIFEEAMRTAFNQEHSLCIFRPICGDIPIIEHNGDYYTCDHYVDNEHLLGNITETPLADLLASQAQRAFGEAKIKTLPQYCRECEVLNMCNGECPKNRFLTTPDGEPGMNYLCVGYKRFFTHIQPFILQVASIWHQQNHKY